ncbi:probable amidase At4g34880 isoform X1 [Prosopis cineraria]|uniref:probable amidase At4g34880 isoform X1 n=1 Tax=Prosopis cineraria TaxID=364024 RepID=UPI0024101B33|nr:probable amidase At4g34880 isoform X1 [Prosopis cineraria]
MVFLMANGWSAIRGQSKRGAVLVDNLEIDNVEIIDAEIIETTALLAEFKLAMNSYLKDLISSPVRTLADIIDCNNKYANLIHYSVSDLSKSSLSFHSH